MVHFLILGGDCIISKKIDFNSYIKNLRHAIFPHVFGYRLNLKEEMRSNIIKAFEREGYVDKKVFYSLFNKDPLKIFKSEFEELLKFGRIEINGDIIQMTVRDRKEISIYSMFFYSAIVINKFKKIINLRNKEYQNIDLKRDYFYE